MVVLAVEIASDRATLGRRHPEVGAASIEDDLEALWRSTDGDLGEILSVQEVLHGDSVVLLALEAGVLEGRLGVSAEVLLAESASMLSDVCVLLKLQSVPEIHIRTTPSALTNCSLSGTFLSFILWTPALADPSSAAAATAVVYFMMADTRSELD